ncbi:PucR family transcriptional regulator [Nocardia sp. CDC160]|uniref:PucR family transcriptional regulator n=1 Tax=Nocardia sp. CDC160 TaxID=3112166 RepID=UPI002DBDF68E|nr:helix-turn-helix domain-containing protein [Nocardia sp. CDC160]MEC3917314.1 helix-turn-helix domain-containing protein [Nocardia sp. CDC160]
MADTTRSTVDNGLATRQGWPKLADRLAQHTNDFVNEVIDQLQNQLEIYRLMPGELLSDDVKRTTIRSFHLLLATLRSGSPPPEYEFEVLQESARRRADERVPLADLLSAYHIGVQVIWWRIHELAEATGDQAELVGIAVAVHRYLRAATMAVLRGYGADESPIPAADHDRRLLFQSLASGSDPVGTAQRLGLPLAELYWVIAIQVNQPPLNKAHATTAAIAARRTIRGLEFELDRIGHGETLRLVSETDGSALLPIDASSAAARAVPMEERFAQLENQLTAVQRAIGAPIVFAVDVARPQDVPIALVEVRDLLRVGRYTRRESGVLRFRDLAVEYQLSRPSRVTHIQRQLLAPLAADPVLRETIQTYVWHQCSATATATALHVHPNTVTYRLRKIAELIGRDLSRPRDLMQVFAAIIATEYAPDDIDIEREIHFD